MRPAKSLLMPILLVGLPLWLAASAGIGLWLHFQSEEQRAIDQQARFARAISIPSIEDDLRKFVTLIGERNASSPAAAESLSRAASMIQGILGPSNMGYAVQRQKGPAAHPILHATLPGTDAKASPVWVLTGYDSRPGSPGGNLNASGVAATLAAAQALANSKHPSAVHFVFIPHVHDPTSPIAETVGPIRTLIAKFPEPRVVLCVDTMASGEPLQITPRPADVLAPGFISDLGSLKTADPSDPDPGFAAAIAATRVATGPVPPPDEPDDRPPFAPTVAASAGRLIELIQRCAGLLPGPG
jgi:hypothetical protein